MKGLMSSTTGSLAGSHCNWSLKVTNVPVFPSWTVISQFLYYLVYQEHLATPAWKLPDICHTCRLGWLLTTPSHPHMFPLYRLVCPGPSPQPLFHVQHIFLVISFTPMAFNTILYLCLTWTSPLKSTFIYAMAYICLHSWMCARSLKIHMTKTELLVSNTVFSACPHFIFPTSQV
jgi:hypothetical protein